MATRSSTYKRFNSVTGVWDTHYFKTRLSDIIGIEEKQDVIKKGTVETAVGTVAKTVTISGYTPTTGDLLFITFTNGNTANSPTLNINGTGAKNIRLGNRNVTGGSGSGSMHLASGAGVLLYFDGTYYILTGNQDQTDATFSAMSVAEGITGTATSSRVMRSDYLKQIIEHYISEGLPDLSGYATQTWTNSQGFLKSSDLSSYATKSGSSSDAQIKFDNNTYLNIKYTGNLVAYIQGGGVNKQLATLDDIGDGDQSLKLIRARTSGASLTSVGSGTTAGSVTVTESLAVGDTLMIELATTSSTTYTPKIVTVTLGQNSSTPNNETRQFSATFEEFTGTYTRYLQSFSVSFIGTTLYFNNKKYHQTILTGTTTIAHTVGNTTLYVGRIWKVSV